MLATSSFVSPYYTESAVAFIAKPIVRRRSLDSNELSFPSPMGIFIESAAKPPMRSGNQENRDDLRYRALRKVYFQIAKFEKHISWQTIALTQSIRMYPVTLLKRRSVS